MSITYTPTLEWLASQPDELLVEIWWQAGRINHEDRRYWLDLLPKLRGIVPEAASLTSYIDALFVSGNDVPVQRAWLNDDSWAIIKECLAYGLPLDYHVVEAEAVYRRKLAAYGDEVRATSPLKALRDSRRPQLHSHQSTKEK